MSELLALIAGLWIGYHQRRILNVLQDIVGRLEKHEQVETEKPVTPKASFAEPMTKAELSGLIEEERIRLLND